MAEYEEMIMYDEKYINRFWDKILVNNPNDPNECWDWLAKKDKNGCGIFSMRVEKREDDLGHFWRSFRAPRLMWILENEQPIPKGMLVIHSCDLETCCNPKHIRLGTYKDNSNDRKLRGRFDTNAKGESHPNSKLTEKLARKICQLYFHMGLKPVEVIERMKLPRSIVYGVMSGKTWKHISKTYMPAVRVSEQEKARIKYKEMYQYYKDGHTVKQCAKKYKLGIEWARDIINKFRKQDGEVLGRGCATKYRKKKNK